MVANTVYRVGGGCAADGCLRHCCRSGRGAADSVVMAASGKPVFPLAHTGGDAEKYFHTAKELRFTNAIPGLTADDYERLGNDAPGVVSDVIELLEKWAHHTS